MSLMKLYSVQRGKTPDGDAGGGRVLWNVVKYFPGYAEVKELFYFLVQSIFENLIFPPLIPPSFWGPKVYYHVYQIAPHVPILSQISPINTLPPVFNIVLPSASRSWKWPLSFRFCPGPRHCKAFRNVFCFYGKESLAPSLYPPCWRTIPCRMFAIA
jgi:hypothetical protein